MEEPCTPDSAEMTEQAASSAAATASAPPNGQSHGVHFYNSLNAVSIFTRNSIPTIHRAISQTNGTQEDTEYVMENKHTKMIGYFDNVNSNNFTEVLGISVLVLREGCISTTGRHAVLHSSHLGQACVYSSCLQDELGLVILEDSLTHFERKKATASGYHALVYPTAEMTLDSFIERLSWRSNWQLCNLVAGGEYVEDTDESDDDSFERIPLPGVDVPLSSLIKLLNSFQTSNKAAIRRLTSSIRHAIVSTKSKSWNTLVENMNVASCIYVVLHLLSITVDPLRHVSVGIFIESLQDLLDERYRFSDDWEVVNVTQRVNKALLLSILNV